MKQDDIDAKQKYQEGFITELENESFPAGLDEQTVRNLSAIKNEPDWLLELKHLKDGSQCQNLIGAN
jgi:hypothetical protein